ncbi:TetR/AcrR family transcriptional regulator [Salipiger sp. 1_MG-2023]|uniref:TetR/AcrR family transcriptional regulator n=1 Tax=Salipiger sp. 1_MG-2023 TaxID=3062665 RepID=UPI0026E39E18|nr:TetR/AcrR family transcriptional regulator [Salipiger sp. 1_MG-2023]MDO6584686.1 TetR/AcrR family transcriptional regulator [Salipiger sp. 1_MG-2023]
MTNSPDRSSQRARTRQAILDGARELLLEGKPVTVAAAAAKNGVSKATSYRYFSTPDVLVAEAVLDIAVKPYEAVVGDQPDLRGKLKAICLYFLDLALENETGFRQFLAAALRDWQAQSHATARGARRISMFRRALSEHDTGLPDDQTEMLVRGLSAATGMEAMIALVDVAGSTPDQAREAVGFMVDAMLDRLL